MTEAMTPKERILNALTGRETDRTPWSPFLAYYWESLPRKVQAKGQFPYLKEMGADPLLRGSHIPYTLRYHNCTITETQRNGKKYVTYETPVGSLTEIHTLSSVADSWFLTGHPVRTEEDFQVLQYIYEHLSIEENIAEFEEDHKKFGEDALLLPLIGVQYKTSFQALVEHWCGTEALTYALYDFEAAVRECLAVMDERDLETVEIAAKTSAEALLFYEDSSTTNISPAFFERYTAPAVNRWGSCLHRHGKMLIHHACGSLRDLLPLMDSTEIDVIESISPPPTGNIDIAGAYEILSDRIGLIGGIEPTFFLNCSLPELETRVAELLSAAKGRRFVLANSDSCPPGVAYEKFTLVSRLVRKPAACSSSASCAL